MRRVSLALTVALVATGCSANLPPPASPPPTLPDGMRPPERGQAGLGLGRVGISTDLPARVDRLAHVEDARYGRVVTTLLCAETPCEVTLPYGDYELRFTSVADSGRTSTAVLSVHEETLVLRHALGQRHGSNAVGPVLVVLGAVTLIGAAIAAAALQAPPPNPSNGRAASSRVTATQRRTSRWAGWARRVSASSSWPSLPRRTRAVRPPSGHPPQHPCLRREDRS